MDTKPPSPKFENLVVTSEGRRGALTLNRPSSLNALSDEMMAEIIMAVNWFNQQPDLSVVVVSGTGRTFCAGFDIRALEKKATSATEEPVSSDTGRLMADVLERMGPVSVARLQGHVIGGGLVLAAACDLRIASSNTRFSIPEIDLGIPLTWGGLPRLLREIGPALVKELIMTCRPFGADEALSMGFLNRVVSENDLDSAVDQLADAIAIRPRVAVLATKAHANAVTADMVGLTHSWSDTPNLAAALKDPEGRNARLSYLERFLEQRDS